MNPTVGIIVAAVSLINIAALVALLFSLDKKPAQSGETTGHVWDENLREFNNPLPRWWLWLFVITVIFGLAYLVIYPGLGNFAGTSGWSSQRQWQQQRDAAEAVLARTFAPFKSQTVAQLAANPDALRIGRNLFMNNCAACHGSDARGAPGFPNLTDRDWLYGGTPDAIMQSIAYGRTGVMPAWRDALGGDQGVEDVLAYVLSLSGRSLPSGNIESGRAKFAAICSACHGADAHGNQTLGAPNLTDQIWLNGGATATLRDVIANGRQGVMPAHLERLGETRVKLLAAYVSSLGGADLGSEARAGEAGEHAEHAAAAAATPALAETK